MDANDAADERCRTRTAKSCGPDASTLASSFAQKQGDGDKKARSPGRSRRKLLKPLRAGMPGCSGEPTVTTSCALYPFCTRDCGCIKRPAFPTPFLGKGGKNLAQLGRIRAARTQTLAGLFGAAHQLDARLCLFHQAQISGEIVQRHASRGEADLELLPDRSAAQA